MLRCLAAKACLLLLASALPNAAVAQDFFGGGGPDDGVDPVLDESAASAFAVNLCSTQTSSPGPSLLDREAGIPACQKHPEAPQGQAQVVFARQESTTATAGRR